LKRSVNHKILSYSLTKETKGYGNSSVISLEDDKSIAKGDSCNTSLICISSHAGTHIDFPKHFLNSGKKEADYNLEDLIFKEPFFIDCPKKRSDLIMPEDIIMHGKGLMKSDILLLRTGFYKFRKKDDYYISNPGIAPETARLIKNKYPNIKAIGIDSISISPYKNRELGRLTHKIFLQKKNPVLLIEDMDLSEDFNLLKKLKTIMVLPLNINELEAAPCTVIAYT